ncbi:MAG: HD-GYP domain-containing protein, partial [Candidatus Eiseniibacteriota bacterium]
MSELRQNSPQGEERDRGTALIQRFNGALRGARMYGAQSPTLHQLVGELLELVQSLIEDELTMVVMGDYFYVNDMRLKPQPTQITLFRALMTEFEDRGLGGVRIQSGISLQELSSFLQLVASVRDEEQGEKLPVDVAQAGIAHIVPIRARDLRSEAQDEDEPVERTPDGERRRAKRTFWRAVNGTRNLVLGAAKSGRPALRQARRLVQPMVDSLMKNEYSILGLTAIKDHDEYTYAHCVNVSVLSIGMGQALGLPRTALANLGVAGLLHDIGKIEVPVGVLQKPGKLSPEEWQVVRRHPLEGLK